MASQLASGVTRIVSTLGAFAALKNDGSLVVWGNAAYGGNKASVASQLTTGVRDVFTTEEAFAALKNDGSVVTWGPASSGGDSSTVAPQLRSGVVSFADPFHHDRLVAPTDPRITLTIAPATGVTEDDTANLIYTFSRTGPTTSALTVNYTVAGTASLGTDYTGITATPANKSITFAAGSPTTTVTVDPITDTTAEANETVTLQLAAGTGYSIATTSAVTGTIRNDDIIGTAANNVLIGTADADLIDGLAGADTLTGLAGADRFAFRFSHSPLTAPDRLTDFAFNSDKITLLSATGSPLPLPSAFSRAADNPTATTLLQLSNSVFADTNGALAGNQPLAPNAAVLVRATNPAIAGTYLLINDPASPLNANIDLLINLTGHSGTLPAIGASAANRIFV